MDWTLEQLRSFTAAADQGSFSEAARSLGRAQSVVSTHIATLEAELGIELFDRSKRLPVLTTAGADLLAEAREVLRRCRNFDDRAIARYNGEAAFLGVAIGDGIPMEALPRNITELARKYPFIRVRMEFCPNDEAWRKVKDGEAQLALAYHNSNTPWTTGYEGRWVASSNQVILASPDHPLGRKGSVTSSELALHRQIVMGDSNRSRPRHVLSTDTWEASNFLVALELVRYGLGWAVLPEALLWWGLRHEPAILVEHMDPPLPVILDTGDWKLPPDDIVMLWNQRYARMDVMDWLRRTIEEDMRRLTSHSDGC